MHMYLHIYNAVAENEVLTGVRLFFECAKRDFHAVTRVPGLGFACRCAPYIAIYI